MTLPSGILLVQAPGRTPLAMVPGQPLRVLSQVKSPVLTPHPPWGWRWRGLYTPRLIHHPLDGGGASGVSSFPPATAHSYPRCLDSAGWESCPQLVHTPRRSCVISNDELKEQDGPCLGPCSSAPSATTGPPLFACVSSCLWLSVTCITIINTVQVAALRSILVPPACCLLPRCHLTLGQELAG